MLKPRRKGSKVKMAKINLILGDSIKELKKIEDESFDLIFADPPYNLSSKVH